LNKTGLTATNEYGANTFPASISTYCLQFTATTLFLGDILKKKTGIIHVHINSGKVHQTIE
jgi:hypothetical protein